jgi:hypothetical protein
MTEEFVKALNNELRHKSMEQMTSRFLLILTELVDGKTIDDIPQLKQDNPHYFILSTPYFQIKFYQINDTLWYTKSNPTLSNPPLLLEQIIFFITFYLKKYLRHSNFILTKIVSVPASII